MPKETISDLIKNLSDIDLTDKTKDQFDVLKQLEQALMIIDTNGKNSIDKQIAKQLIVDAVYVSHLYCMRYYQINDALTAISKIQNSLSVMMEEMSRRRPRIPLVGITADGTLMPMAFQSEAEAKSYVESIKFAADGNVKQIHLTAVELSTTGIVNTPIKQDTRVEDDTTIILPAPKLKVKQKEKK